MLGKINNLWNRIKDIWDIWYFVIIFPIAIMFIVLGWFILTSLTEVKLLDFIFSVLCLYALFTMIISFVIAISENNVFVSAFILLFMGVLIAVTGYQYAQDTIKLDWLRLVDDFYANISTELISIVITVLAIEKLQERTSWRDYRRRENFGLRTGNDQEDANIEPTGIVEVASHENIAIHECQKNGRLLPFQENYISPAGIVVGAICGFFAFLIGVLFARYSERRNIF